MTATPPQPSVAETPNRPLRQLGFLTIDLFDLLRRAVEEVAFALPFTFEHAAYVQIITDIATRLGPALDWRPTTA